VKGFVLSDALTHVPSGATDSCLQAHNSGYSPCNVCVSASLNLYNYKRITVLEAAPGCGQVLPKARWST